MTYDFCPECRMDNGDAIVSDKGILQLHCRECNQFYYKKVKGYE